MEIQSAQITTPSVTQKPTQSATEARQKEIEESKKEITSGPEKQDFSEQGFGRGKEIDVLA